MAGVEREVDLPSHSRDCFDKTPEAEENVIAETDEPHELAPSLSAATQSLLLALGVVLVLALIGFGIYYSRISQ